MDRSIAYFSMEIALNSKLPTYSGGLGVLAGDTLKSMADLNLPVIAVSLLYHKGYFKQSISSTGKQTETDVKWKIEDFLTPLPNRVSVTIEGKEVEIGAWMIPVVGISGGVVPTIFLDTDLPENSKYHRTLTDHLYGGDAKYRLAQEIVLGIGGIRMLESLGYTSETGLKTYHMNEGHAALLTLALLEQKFCNFDSKINENLLDHLKELCVFTTHTPVPAGHDIFPKTLVSSVLGKNICSFLEKNKIMKSSSLNMTELAIYFSGFINGVAKRHGEVSQKMFPNEAIFSITNGVHVRTWLSTPFEKLFDEYLEDWILDSYYLRYACEIPLKKIAEAHLQAKKDLFSTIKKLHNISFDPKVFTIGFARRAATYKRADLLFNDYSKLVELAKKYPIQIVYAGKAHPKDKEGKKLIENVVSASKKISKNIKIVYIENYDMDLGKLITSGVDIWLNNPIKPLEASGTSGMKAALNGVPSFSTLDGWWVEGHIEGVTGWEIEDKEDAMKKGQDIKKERVNTALNIYSKLEKTILPMYYNSYDEYCKIMRNSISINASYFNTQRMVQQYQNVAY